MDQKIITISREFGSGGRTIGKMVAETLGVPYYDKELVKRVATETGFDELFVETAGVQFIELVEDSLFVLTLGRSQLIRFRMTKTAPDSPAPHANQFKMSKSCRISSIS